MLYMKLLILLAGFLTITGSSDSCKTQKGKPLKGRLEIKGICSNYTLALVEGDLDTSLISSSWTDDHANKTYKNDFGLGNPCSFPDTIKQGDEFYFVVDTSAQKDCMVCMAYYPTPPRKINIKVVNK